MLYITENTNKLEGIIIEKSIPLLSLQRIQRMDELRVISDKINCAVCYLMLRKGLHDEYGIKDSPEFTYGKHGKPSLKEFPNIHFNFSHCRNSCACIISDSQTAVDIADKRFISMQTAKRFCSVSEYETASALSDPSGLLVRLWSVKECVSKLDGRGLFADFKEITEDTADNIFTIDGGSYYCSYYSKNKLKPVYLTADELLNI